MHVRSIRGGLRILCLGVVVLLSGCQKARDIINVLLEPEPGPRAEGADTAQPPGPEYPALPAEPSQPAEPNQPPPPVEPSPQAESSQPAEPSQPAPPPDPDITEWFACDPTGAVLLNPQKGFFVASYPGTSLHEVQLTVAAKVRGVYRLVLTVRQDSEDGAVVGTSSTGIIVSADAASRLSATFSFNAVPVPMGTRLAFYLTSAAAPTGGVVSYFGAAKNCPVRHASGAGVGVRIRGH